MIDPEDHKQAEKEFRKLLDVLPQYMCVYEADGSPLYANDSLLEFFGFTLNDFRADDVQTRAFHPEDVERVRKIRSDAIGRRNFALRAEGLLAIVCPVGDGSDVAGVGIFNATVEEVDRLMRDDPAVQEGVLLYELHSCRSFPGDQLPK
jgi:PAS domain-containing protein